VAQLEDAAVLGIVPVDITPGLVAQLEKQSPQLAAYVQAFPHQVPPPHRRLPKAAIDLYQEAREVAAASPRSAAALLRALEALLEELHPSGRRLVERIDELHAEGLPTPQTQAMDVLRLIGNEAAHAGTLHDADNPETVRELFRYLNYLAESSETVRRIATSYQSLPRPGSTVSVFCRWDLVVAGRGSGRDGPWEAPAEAIIVPGRWIGHRWARRPSWMQAAAGPRGAGCGDDHGGGGSGRERHTAQPVQRQQELVRPMASGWAGAGATAALSGSAALAGPGSGSAASWW